MAAEQKPPLSLSGLRSLTPARVALGRRGASLPTTAMLSFTLDHARARDAVHAGFDAEAIRTAISAGAADAIIVSSEARDRHEYLARPDRGRRLDEHSRQLLQQHAPGPTDVVFIISDGLSPRAAARHGPPLLHRLARDCRASHLGIGPVVIARQARVALGDEIGACFGAHLVVMLIGERPGLTTPASLGVYLTAAPRIGRTDAERNCISNIHESGLSIEAAAAKTMWLIRNALAAGRTGVMLKDKSGEGAEKPLIQHFPH